MTFTKYCSLPILMWTCACSSSNVDPICDQYLECVAAVQPSTHAEAMDLFGKSSDCWGSTGAAKSCVLMCEKGLNDLFARNGQNEACKAPGTSRVDAGLPGGDATAEDAAGGDATAEDAAGGDVGPFCGNEVCDDDEDARTCPDDCPAKCGDGICSCGETHGACDEDCQTSWVRKDGASQPKYRFESAMTYDARRGVTVLFGGYLPGKSSTKRVNDTWSWDGESWTLLSPPVQPPARAAAAIAYDSDREVVVMFGGSSDDHNVQLDDTWEWDGSTWTERATEGGPGQRYGATLAYDKERKVIVLFGGFDSTTSPITVLRETWEWNGTVWTQRTPATSPAGRYRHAMTYDSSRNRTIVYGGRRDGILGDTWEWDGNNWTQKKADPSPLLLPSSKMVYDSSRCVAVLFGKAENSDGAQHETWEWNGSSWANVTTDKKPPPQRYHSMAFDLHRNRVVLYGGLTPEGSTSEDEVVWEYGIDVPTGDAN